MMLIQKIKIFLFLGINLLMCYQAPAQSAANYLKLWYDKPATKWEEALPVGNGRLGAMVFGGPQL